MGDDFDNLLNSMKEKMNEVGSSLSAYQCFGCKKEILSGRLEIMGHTWHETCFKCTRCKSDLPYSFYDKPEEGILTYSSIRKKRAMESSGLPYCEDCYYSEFGNKCEHCYQELSGAFVSALGKKYHPEHFLCSKCSKCIANTKYFLRSGKFVCKECS